MAKESGLGWTTFSVDDSAGTPRDLKDATHSLEFATPREVQDITGLGVSAIERLHLLADFSATAEGTFKDDSNDAHAVFSNLANTRTWAMAVSGQTLNNEVLLTEYGLTRGDDGSLTWKVPAVLQSGTVPAWS